MFGRCLTFDRPASAALRDGTGVVRTLEVTGGSCWELCARVRGDVPQRDHDVLVHNGYGGPAAWRSAGRVRIGPPVAWKTDVFDVMPNADGDGTEESIREAFRRAAANGGGVVLLKRGVYDMKGGIEIPPQTVLRGEGTGLVSLYWPDLESPPDALIKANDCGIEDLSIYCRKHIRVIDSNSASERLRVNRVRARANAFFMHTNPGAVHRGRKAPEKLGEGQLLRVIGRNFQITDCDLWGSGQVLAIDPHGFAGERPPSCGLIRGNRIAYGYQGHLFENVDRLIFEGNELVACGPTAGGNGISAYWNNFSRHVFYARNRVHDIYGIDRETMTLDGGGGAYFGTAVSDGAKLVLDADPVYKDYAPTPRTDYRGAAVYVLHGRGAGQYRFVVSNQGREWTVDRAWDVSLDGTSLLSIVPFRGRNLFVGNRLEDAGAFELYGSAADVVVADNTGARIDGIFAWGLNQHGWGWHPVLRCQFLGNTIAEGSGYGSRVSGPAFLGVVTTGNNEQYPGPLARAVVVRNNRLLSQAFISLTGTIDGVVVEGNTISHSARGVRIGENVSGVLIRQNRYDDVKERITGNGKAAARVADE